jgi:hypothetical protein
MWSSALEKLYRLTAAFSSQMGNFKVLAGTHDVWSNIRPGTKRAIKWALGVLGVAIAFSILILSFGNPLGGRPSPTPKPTQTPYSLLGVTTTSSTMHIAKAYCKLTHEARTRGPFGSGLFAGKQLEAYRKAYTTITVPFQRCVYHQENNIPDWYGVPSPLMCEVEVAINELEAAKADIYFAFGPNYLDGAVERMYRTVEQCVRDKLAGRARRGSQEPPPGMGKGMTGYLSSAIEKKKEFWVGVWTRASARGHRRLGWLGEQARELSAPSPSREALIERGSLLVLVGMVAFCLVGYFRPMGWMTVESESGFDEEVEDPNPISIVDDSSTRSKVVEELKVAVAVPIPFGGRSTVRSRRQSAAVQGDLISFDSISID